LEETVEEIQAKITWIEENLQGNTPMRDVLSSDSPKQNILYKWGQCLEELTKRGIRKKPLTTISTDITQRLRELNLNTAVRYVRTVLPSKWKDPSKIHEQDGDNERREISSNEKVILTEYDIKLIDHLKATSDFCLSAIEKIKTKPFMDKLNKKEKNYQDVFFLKWKNLINSCNEAKDERNEVIASKQFLYMYAKSLTTLGDTYDLFVRFLREFSAITTKQAGKILNGRVSNLDVMYRPKNRLEAKDLGFYGFPCEECNEWMCEYKWNGSDHKIFCWACQQWSEPKTERLPRSE